MSTTIIADIDISMFGDLRMPLAPAIQWLPLAKGTEDGRVAQKAFEDV
ncbi:MAG TPA: hypothetical protein VF418_02795 [Sphingomonadaceae bacterium]